MHTRRELLRGAGRAAALAGLGCVAWILGRRKGAASSAAACVNDSRCDYCGIFHRCDLKAAEDYRKALEDGHAG